jgi:RHH-type rel operon transcriptional repressor/antitoxin RelB
VVDGKVRFRAVIAMNCNSGLWERIASLDSCGFVVLNMFNMLGIRLEPELEEKLESLAKETGRSKSYYAREAIRTYLEDREDYLKGIAALERREPSITLEELERRLGLNR